MKAPRLIALAAGASIALAGCGSDGGAGSGAEPRLTLVSYSTPREANQTQIRGFNATPAGEGVRIDKAYGASGEQSRAVVGGLPADVVAFALAPDMERLVEAGKVDPDWSEGPHGGMVTRSLVVFAVRKGNPKGIEDWDDLVADGVEVVTPNPFTSGGARWNLMAAYGAQLEAGRSAPEALDFVRMLLEHTPVQSKSAREALQVFTTGKGDVMLAYENEAIVAQQEGEEIEYVIPDATILIENPVAVTSDSEFPEQASAFVDHLYSPEGQRTYGKAGYRPVDARIAAEFDDFEDPETLFTIDDLGGWDEVTEEFFDREQGAISKMQEELGANG